MEHWTLALSSLICALLPRSLWEVKEEKDILLTFHLKATWILFLC